MNVVASTSARTEVEIKVPGLWVEEVEADGTTFKRFELPAYGTTANEGWPELPAVAELFAVPGRKNVALNVLDEDTTTLTGYRVFPYQPSPPDGGWDCNEFYYDEEFYETDADWPAAYADLGAPAIWRDLRVVHPVFYPLRANPHDKTVVVTYYARLELVYSGTSDENAKDDPDYDIERKHADAYAQLIPNYELLDLPVTEWDLGAATDYLIIYAPALATPATRLVPYGNARGFRTTAVSCLLYTSPSPRDS